MKLKDCRDAEVDFSARASDIARYLAFAGIAIVWIFKYEVGGQNVVPKGLVFPTVLIILGLAVDLIHYVFAATYWGIFVKEKEKELVVNPGQPNEHFNEEAEFTNRLWYDRVVNGFFYSKITLIVVGYVFLLYYLIGSKLFQ